MTQEFVTLPREVVKQALAYVEQHAVISGLAVRDALRAPLEQPRVEQEPEAWALSHSKGLEFSSKYPMQKSKQAAEQMARQHMGAVTVSPLYTHPQPKLKPLTDEQIAAATGAKPGTPMWLVAVAFTRDIEAAHNIK